MCGTNSLYRQKIYTFLSKSNRNSLLIRHDPKFSWMSGSVANSPVAIILTSSTHTMLNQVQVLITEAGENIW